MTDSRRAGIDSLAFAALYATAVDDLRRALYLILADDEPDTVSTLATILSDEGNEVVQASKGPEVLAAARSRKPDALILDIDMPGMAVTRSLERYGNSSNTPRRS